MAFGSDFFICGKKLYQAQAFATIFLFGQLTDAVIILGSKYKEI